MADNIPASPAPVPPNAPLPAGPVIVTAAKPYTGLAVTGWVLIILTCLLSVIPVLGFGSWLLAVIVVPLAVVFAIIMMSRGATGHGIFLIIAAVILMPLFIFIAPMISTVVLGASVSAQEKKQEVQILSNLDMIEMAKSQWAFETKASSGAPVTMSELGKYLDGKQIKPVVGETYDPHAVGQNATAKLPSNKSLGSHKAGEEISAATAATPAASEASSTSPSPSASESPDEE